MKERPERTAQGYRRFRCLDCTKQFNERSSGLLNRTQYPSDVIALVVLWRLRYKLSLRDLAEMFLIRGFSFTYEAVRDWEAKLTPALAENLRRKRKGRVGGSWYTDETYIRVILTESQLAALEKAKADKEAHGEFDTACPGYCGAQDTFYVGTLKGVGRIYQQTFIDTYTKVGFAKLYDRRTPITAADLLNDRVIPFFEAHDVPLQRILTDRGTEYCGTHDRHEYELYLAVENIDHTRTKTKSPQTNGIVERFHKTMLDEFYRVAFRRKIYDSIDDLQQDLDDWIAEYNEVRTHQGRYCFGKTPMQTLLDARQLAHDKQIGGQVPSHQAV